MSTSQQATPESGDSWQNIFNETAAAPSRPSGNGRRHWNGRQAHSGPGEGSAVPHHDRDEVEEQDDGDGDEQDHGSTQDADGGVHGAADMGPAQRFGAEGLAAGRAQASVYPSDPWHRPQPQTPQPVGRARQGDEQN